MKQSIIALLLLLLCSGAAAQDAVFAAEEFAELDALDGLSELDEELGGFDDVADEFDEQLDEELGDFDEIVELDFGFDDQTNLRGSSSNARKLQYVGYNAYCDLCRNKAFPPNNVGVAVLGMPGRHTCASLYQRGRASQIPFNYCPVMQTALNYKCGCDKAKAGATSSGRSKYGTWNVGGSSVNKWRGNSGSSSNRWRSSGSTKWKSSNNRWKWSTSSNFPNRFLRFLGLDDQESH